MPIQLLRCVVMSFRAARWAAVWPGGSVAATAIGATLPPETGMFDWIRWDATLNTIEWRTGPLQTGRSDLAEHSEFMVRFWGVRGSIACPGESHQRYGGNTSCLEVRCGEGTCEAETGDAFTPMSVRVDDSGAMSVCAYSGCWVGTGEVVRSEEFLVLIGHDLKFSTSPDSESAEEDIVIAIDRADGIATLKAGEFAHPLLCESLGGAQ